MQTLQDLINILRKIVDEGVSTIEPSEADEAIRMSVDIFEIIKSYTTTHDLALECGGEYIYQNDDAQVDALKLACDICEKLKRYSEYEE